MSGDGPAAIVSAALPKALRGLDHRVTVLSPLLRSVDPKALSLARRLSKVEFDLGGERRACEIYDGRTPAGIDLLFVGHEELLHTAGSLTDGDPAEAAMRAGLFARAAAEVMITREPRVELVHAHEWPGAACLVAARERGATALPMVLTLHDLSRLGDFDVRHAAVLGIPASLQVPDAHGHISVTRAGVRLADRVTTVSPTAARSLLASDHPLRDDLAKLGERLTGIPSGVDASVWNPVTDPSLPARFDPMDRTGKERCKGDLQQALALPVGGDVPLLSVLATTPPADAPDLLVKTLPLLLRNDVQVVVQIGEGTEVASVLDELADRYPDRLKVRPFEDAMRHRIVAASDLVLVAARRAPAAFAQLYAHRYGAIPVARRVDAVADSVVDCDAKLATGTGFLFDEDSPEAMLAACQRGLGAFTSRRAFAALSRRVMRIDHSWDRSARLYDGVYRTMGDPGRQ